jgi:hypothetical protein
LDRRFSGIVIGGLILDNVARFGFIGWDEGLLPLINDDPTGLQSNLNLRGLGKERCSG